jgi:hypothetical protein
LVTKRSTTNEKDCTATVTSFIEQEIPPYDSRKEVLTLSTYTVWNTAAANHATGRLVAARAWQRHKPASAGKATVAKVDWDLSGGFFGWLFKLKQLLQ